ADSRVLGRHLRLGLRQLRGLLLIGRLRHASRQDECGERHRCRRRYDLLGHQRPPGLYAPGAPGPCTVISIRRFAARPCGVSLEATGCVSPKPLAETMLGLSPCETRKVATVAARRVDKTRLSGIPWRCS